MTNVTDIPELLAPARDREAFLAAVAAGANAIYCGVAGGLNARRRAAGIDVAELGRLCELAHSRGVRVYVTANVVVKQAELADALEQLGEVLAAGADALIIQDLGLMRAVHMLYPTAEIHVSTQANVHDARGVALCAELGASRVTLSRELPLGEIAAIAEVERRRAAACGGVPCELEVFAHGAICPSYSGLCMLSSFLREGRSPNRGLCAQPCRLPFDLVRAGSDERLQPADRERALCTHDNCALDDIAELAAAGVASLKLEGRMKPAAYVHAVTGAWRRELDELFGGGLNGEAAALRRRELKRSFNRGLTDAYLHGSSGNDLMSYERSGNRGELVGRVVAFEPEEGFVPRDGQKMRGASVVSLHAFVGAGDSLELRDPSDPDRFLVVEVPHDASAGEELRCPVPRPVGAGYEARVTKSLVLECAARDAVGGLQPSLDGANCSKPDGFSPDKVKSELFAAVCGVPARRLAPPATELCALAGSLEDARRLRKAGAGLVYVDAGLLGGGVQLRRAVLEEGFVPLLGEVCRSCDHDQVDGWIAGGAPVAVGNLSELALARERGACPEVWGCVPAHNSAALQQLAGLGARGAWLSCELSCAEMAELAGLAPACDGEAQVWLGVLAFGRPRLMTCEHCVLQVAYSCDRNHAACAHCRQPHELVNIDGRHLPVGTDVAGRSRVYLDEPLDLVPFARELAQAGVRRFMVDAATTSVEQAEHALGRLARALAGEVEPAVAKASGLAMRGVE